MSYSEDVKPTRNGAGRVFTEWHNPHHGFFYTVNRTLYRGRTQYQEIELIETEELGRVLLLDGITQVGDKVERQYHEPMVHLPMLSHPAPEKVLVIGGGDGGILRELLRYDCLRHIDFVELDQEVVEFSRRYLASVHAGSFDNPKVHSHFRDGRSFVERSTARYDVVIMDMTDPSGPSRMLYTREFFAAVKQVLEPDNGMFVMHSESPVARPAAFRCIRSTLGAVFPLVCSAYTFVQMYATLWSVSIASTGPDPRGLGEQELNTRMNRAGLGSLETVSPGSWHALFSAPPYIARLAAEPGRIVSDAEPGFPDEFS